MANPIVVTFYDFENIPQAGLTPSFAAPGYYKTLAGVDTAAPAVTDGGDGDYSFTPSDADASSGIRYLLDAGVTAAPRFYGATILPTAAAAAATTVSVTGVNVFGVTPSNLYRRHLPQHPEPTTDSNPSYATVAEVIDECAATLEAKLLQESIVATALLVSNAAAYLWCRATLRLQALVEILPTLQGQDSALLKRLRDELDARWAELSAKGYLALGSGVSAPSTQPDGPTHFIDSLGIDVSETASLASGVVARLRRDDKL